MAARLALHLVLHEGKKIVIFCSNVRRVEKTSLGGKAKSAFGWVISHFQLKVINQELQFKDLGSMEGGLRSTDNLMSA